MIVGLVGEAIVIAEDFRRLIPRLFLFLTIPPPLAQAASPMLSRSKSIRLMNDSSYLCLLHSLPTAITPKP